MTLELKSMVREEWSDVEGMKLFGIYGAHERLYLTLLKPELLEITRGLDKKVLRSITFQESRRSLQAFADLAETMFDVPFEFDNPGVYNMGIFFKPEITEGMNKIEIARVENCRNHVFEFPGMPFIFPQVTIELGWRGNSKLHEDQRNKYFQFLKGIYNTVLEKVKDASR